MDIKQTLFGTPTRAGTTMLATGLAVAAHENFTESLRTFFRSVPVIDKYYDGVDSLGAATETHVDVTVAPVVV